uniref:Uncharacterized protein n=1 Tax=Anguilla anguilla TaxID=7936 RepID=A0A0E9R3V4_ANGAN
MPLPASLLIISVLKIPVNKENPYQFEANQIIIPMS